MPSRQRDYAAEYARRVELGQERAERLGIQFSLAAARGHARPGDLPAREQRQLERDQDRIERGQHLSTEQLGEYRGAFQGVTRSAIPEWLYDYLVDDLGMDDESAWGFLYGGSD